MRGCLIRSLLIGAVLARLAAAESPFDPPLGGWTFEVQPGQGSFTDVAVTGLEAWPRAQLAIGIPDGANGAPLYDRRQAWPLVVVLHGSNGNHESLAGVFRGTFKQFGAITVFPGCLDANPLLEWNYPDEMAYVLHVIRQMAKLVHLDPRRIYLIGHSMGGGGTYCQGSVMRSAWAALGPMAGYWQFSPSPQAARMTALPIRILHGVNDSAVPIAQGDAANAALVAAGNTRVVYDRIAGKGHSDILVSGGTRL